jgi:hypothetical protein
MRKEYQYCKKWIFLFDRLIQHFPNWVPFRGGKILREILLGFREKFLIFKTILAVT